RQAGRCARYRHPLVHASDRSYRGSVRADAQPRPVFRRALYPQRRGLGGAGPSSLAAFVLGAARASEHLRLIIDAHASLAFATGALLNVKSGKRIEIEQRFGHRLGALRLDGPRASWLLEFQIARTMIARRFALAGDAARSVHPLAGQGLNLAFRDVAALTQCVAEAMRLGLDPGDGTVLEHYERWRRFDSVTSAAAFDALNGLFSNDSVLSRAARDAGLGIVDRLPGLKQVIVREAAGQTGDMPRLLRGERV
ncbi:MAG: hypothetical protein HC869_19015, partial [Rhodospirillales bacterium]|nr:hypothetical protein [Rhodospirillales bacterium]